MMEIPTEPSHEAFDRKSADYDAYAAGYVATQQEYPHGPVTLELARQAAGGNPWSDEALLLGRPVARPDTEVRDKLVLSIKAYGLADSGSAPDNEEMNRFFDGARQARIDMSEGVRL